MADDVSAGAGVSERAPDAGRGEAGRATGSSALANPAVPSQRGLWARRKQGAVLRLLRKEDLEPVSRELGVTAADLSGWRDDLLTAGEASLKSRPEAFDRQEIDPVDRF